MNLDDFSNSEQTVLRYLWLASFRRGTKTNTWVIARKTGTSQSHVYNILKKFKELGLVVRSRTGIYFMPRSAKEQVKALGLRPAIVQCKKCGAKYSEILGDCPCCRERKIRQEADQYEQGLGKYA